MKIVADLHTHSLGSGHAYSPIEEMIKAAAKRGLKMLALTEHGPSMPGGPHLYYFYNIKVIPNFVEGVEILRGVEANIVDREGTIDLDDEHLEKLDWVLAGFHIVCSPEGSIEENTQALIKAIENPRVDGVVHPGNPDFLIDPLPVVKAAKANGKVLEINNSSVRKGGSVRVGSRENCLKLATLAKEYGVQVMLNSDAHISFDVGRFDNALELALEVGLTEDNVLNTSLEKIKSFLARRGKERREVLLKPLV